MVSSEQIETLKGIVGRDNIRQDADSFRQQAALNIPEFRRSSESL